MLSFKNFIESQIVVYHASSEPIKKFDISKRRSGYYPGFYTTTKPEYAAEFGTHPHEFSIDSSKYYEIKDADELKRQASLAGFRTNQGSGTGEVEYLKSLGYQGIKRGIEYIVFDPESTLTLNQSSPNH